MNRIISYIISMMPYMLLSMVLIVLVRFIKYRKTKKLNWYYEFCLMIFIMFLIGLASQTIIPKIEFGINGLSIIKNSVGGINLIPLKVIVETYYEVFKNGHINYFIINFLGNIIMFMPIGFFIPLLWNIKDKKVILIGFMVSLFIEVSQLFLNRATDIDDLLLNTLGTTLGLLVYKLLLRINKRIVIKFRKL